MEFALSEEQQMLADTVDKLLDEHCNLDRVRQQVAEGGAEDDALWRRLAELGLTGLLIPEAFGGAGLKLLDAMVVQEMLGRHVAPVAFLSSAVLAPLAITLAGSEQQKQAWLPRLANGDLRVALGLSECAGARENAGLENTGGKLSGRALFVLGPPDPELYLVAATDGTLHAVRAGATGLDVSSLRSIDDTCGLSELNLAHVECEQLPEGDQREQTALVDAGRIMLAADSLGAAQRMLEMAVAYSLERKQFNRAIGSFQAVKHLCAEMAAELEPCRSLVWYAAYAFDDMPEEARLMACHAKSELAEVGRFVARTATEVHGGMGFTDLLGLHYWFKRLGVNRQLLGGPERVREEAAALQGWIG